MFAPHSFPRGSFSHSFEPPLFCTIPRFRSSRSPYGTRACCFPFSISHRTFFFCFSPPRPPRFACNFLLLHSPFFFFIITKRSLFRVSNCGVSFLPLHASCRIELFFFLLGGPTFPPPLLLPGLLFFFCSCQKTVSDRWLGLPLPLFFL